MSTGVTLLSGAQTASGVQLLGEFATPKSPKVSLVVGLVLELNVTAATALTSLDLYLQHSVDGGTNWDDFIHFAQVTSSPGIQYAQWLREGFAPSSAVHARANKALAASTVLHGPVGDDWQLAWTLVGTSVTFSVLGRYIHRAR